MYILYIIRIRMIPVYELLKSSVEDKDLTVLEKEEFITNIKEMNSIGHELVYVIIKSFEKDNSDSETFFPYNGKIQKSGIRFEIESLDNRLRQILYKFSKMHLETQNEQNGRMM